MPLHVTYDRAALAAFTVGLDRASDIVPRNAHVRLKLSRMVLRRARMGWSIDEHAVAKALDPMLGDPYATRVLRADRSRVPPAVNANDLRRRYRVVVTIDRRHFKLRYFRNLKHRKTLRRRGRDAGIPDAGRALHDRQTRRRTRTGTRPTSRGPAPTATRSSRAAPRTTR